MSLAFDFFQVSESQIPPDLAGSVCLEDLALKGDHRHCRPCLRHGSRALRRTGWLVTKDEVSMAVRM